MLEALWLWLTFPIRAVIFVISWIWNSDSARAEREEKRKRNSFIGEARQAYDYLKQNGVGQYQMEPSKDGLTVLIHQTMSPTSPVIHRVTTLDGARKVAERMRSSTYA